MYAHNAFVRWFHLVIVVSVAIEIAWYLLVRKRDYPWREMLTSVAIFVMRMPVRLLTAVIVAPVGYFLWSHRVATVPLNTAWGLARMREHVTAAVLRWRHMRKTAIVLAVLATA